MLLSEFEETIKVGAIFNGLIFFKLVMPRNLAKRIIFLKPHLKTCV